MIRCSNCAGHGLVDMNSTKCPACGGDGIERTVEGGIGVSDVSGKTEAGAELIVGEVLAERMRQIDIGYDAEHDDQHMSGEIARAAACYAVHPQVRLFGIDRLQVPTQVWPYRWEFAPESATRDNLIKAAAMLIAEVERLDRAKAVQQ